MSGERVGRQAIGRSDHLCPKTVVTTGPESEEGKGWGNREFPDGNERWRKVTRVSGPLPERVQRNPPPLHYANWARRDVPSGVEREFVMIGMRGLESPQKTRRN